MKSPLSVLAGVVIAMLSSASAHAHHSGAAYDGAQQLTVDGAVKEWRWTNPHSWLQITAPDAEGKDVVWSFESTATQILIKQGWTRTIIGPGDKIKVIYNPLKDGMPGGRLIGVILPDGKALGAPSGSGGGPGSASAPSGGAVPSSTR